MLGAIIGDIAGSAYEFHNTDDYNCACGLTDWIFMRGSLNG